MTLNPFHITKEYVQNCINNNINFIEYDGKTLLHILVMNKQVMKLKYDLIIILIDAGADLNIQDKYGNTVLHYAIINNKYTAMYDAISHKNLTLVKILVHARYDINKMISNELTVVQYAILQEAT